MTGAANKTRRWTVAVFAIALMTRLLWIGVPLNVDEELWMRRGPAFMQAVLQGKAADTYQRHHPGVTNMWLIGGAVASRYLLRGLTPADAMARQTAPELQRHFADLPAYLAAVTKLPTMPLELYVQARILAALVTAACVAGFYALSRRLFGATVATIAAVILLFEPFYLGYQRFLTTDANQTNFTWLALLAFLLSLRTVTGKQSWTLRWWLLSGALFGLALLSKVSAMLSLPAFVLAAAWMALRVRSRDAMRHLALGILVWALAAFAVAVLLWPALRVDLPGTVMRLFNDVGGEIDGHIQFFLGRTVENPGFAFYPVVLVYRLSPLLLLGTMLGLISLGLPSLRRHLRESASLAVIVLDLGIVLLAVSSVDSKLDRYIMPLVPGLALVAASGISAVMSRLAEIKAGDRSRKSDRLRVALSRPGAVLTAILLIQLGTVLPHVPYFVTYFNPLAGGPAQAQKLLMIGNGELLDRAAAWLGQQIPRRDATVVTWYQGGFEPYYGGPSEGLGGQSPQESEKWRRANFVVLYINMVQRNWPSEIVQYFRSQRPLYQAQVHGVNYVQVYQGPSVREVDLAKVAHRADLEFDGNARLMGYELETPEVPAGQTVVLALFWQALEPFPSPDFTVHLGIRDADGNVWGGSDSRPVGGMLPVDQWQPGQILRDVQRVTVPPGTPPGEYDLEVSFWSPTLQRALDIYELGTPVGRQVALAKLKVTRPAKPPVLTSDLQIANRVADEVRVAPGAARLVGYQWPQPTNVHAGDAIPLVLLWQAGTHEIADVQLRLRLGQGGGRWQRAVGHPLGGNYAPESWTPGQLVRDVWNALLPADAPAGRSRLELVAQTPTGDMVLLDLGSVDVLARQHDFAVPRPQFVQEASLGNVTRLLGYAQPEVVQPGQVLPVTLYWEALGESERNYVRFVHMLDADDRIVAQQDGIPGDGRFPLTGWLVGEYVQDDLIITVPADLPSGRYRLAVGLYDPTTGQRLTTHDYQERVVLSRNVDVR